MWLWLCYIPNIPNKRKSLTSGVTFPTNRWKCFLEKKKNITFWGWKPSKNKNIEPHQNFVGSYIRSTSLGSLGWTFYWKVNICVQNVLNYYLFVKQNLRNICLSWKKHQYLVENNPGGFTKTLMISFHK